MISLHSNVTILHSTFTILHTHKIILHDFSTFNYSSRILHTGPRLSFLKAKSFNESESRFGDRGSVENGTLKRKQVRNPKYGEGVG